LSRSPAPAALLRLSEVVLDAGPPHFVRVPTCVHACRPGGFILRSEFVARDHGHPLDGAGSFVSLSRHLSALLLVKGFLRQTKLASVHRSRHSQESVFRKLEVRTYSCKRQGAPRLAS